MRINRFFLAVTLLLLGAGGGQGKSLTPQQALLQAKGKNLELRRLIAQQCETLERLKRTQAQLDTIDAILGRVEKQLKELEKLEGRYRYKALQKVVVDSTDKIKESPPVAPNK